MKKHLLLSFKALLDAAFIALNLPSPFSKNPALQEIAGGDNTIAFGLNNRNLNSRSFKAFSRNTFLFAAAFVAMNLFFAGNAMAARNRVTAIAIGGQSSAATYGTANAGVSFAITLTEGNVAGTQTTDQFAFAWTGAVPTGVTTPATLTFTPSGATQTYTVPLATSATTPAGSYPFKLTLTENNSGPTPQVVTGTLVVSGAPLTITANNQNKGNFGTTFTFAGTEFTFSGIKNSDAVSSVTLNSTGAPATGPAGTSPIVPSAASGTGLANYIITYVNGTMTVNKAPLTLTATNVTKTYGTLLSNGLSSAVTATGLVNGNTVTSATLTYGTGALANAAVNTYTGTAVPSSPTGGGGFLASNYNITTTTPGNIIVNPAALNISGTANKVYGVTLAGGPGSTVFSSTGLQNSETIGSVTGSYGTGAAATDPVGSYTGQSMVSTATGGTFTPSNYTITYTAGDLVVTPAPLTVKANNQSKVYGVTFTFTGNEYTTTGLLNSDNVTSATFNSTGSVSTATVAGSTYPIIPSAATGTGLSNYTITYTNGAMTVTKAPVLITANDVPKIYGTALANTTNSTAFTVTGLQNGNTITTVSITYTTGAGTGALAAANVGTYANQATPSAAGGTGGGYIAGNYAITYAQGDIIVSPAALSISGNATKVYGNTLASGSGATGFTATGLKNGETIGSVTGTYGTGSAATDAVGTYTGQSMVSAATGGTFTATNYTITYVAGDITVTKAALTITANNQTKAYGTTFTFAGTEFTTTGLKNSDAVSSVSFAASGAAATAAAGSSSITPSAAVGTGLTNYNITYVSGTMTVTKAILTITANDVSKVFGSTLTNGSSTAFTSTGLQNGNTLTSVTMAYGTGAAATAAVNTYSNTATPSNAVGANGYSTANYTLVYVQGDIIVTPASLTIAAKNISKVYGATYTFAVADLTITGRQNTDNITSVNTTSAGAAATANVGTYPIIPAAPVTGNSGFNASNYTITYNNGTMTVTPAPLSISADNQVKITGDPNPTLTYTVTGLLNGDALTSVPLPVTSVDGTTPVGTYSITISGGSAGSNYTIAYTAGVFTVNPKLPVLSYTNPPPYLVGTGITPLVPSNSGGPVSTTGTYAPGVVILKAANGLNKPYGLVADTTGNVFVTNFGANTITEYSTTGVISTFSTGASTGPAGIVFDSNNIPYVLNQATKTVVKYPSGLSGAGVTIITGLSTPTGIAIDGSDNIYVANSGNATITKYTSAGGAPILTMTPPNGNPFGLGANGDVTGGIAVDPAGNILVVDNDYTNYLGGNFGQNVIDVYSSSGVYQGFYGIGDNSSSIAIDNIGNIFLSDVTDRNVTVYTPNFASQTIIETGFSSPRGVAPDGQGNFYISDYNNNTVTKYSPVKGYYLTGTLPAGLNFDTNTGIVSGRPEKPFALTTYTVTAYNVSGKSTTTFKISCNPNPPIITYTPQVNVYQVNTAITPLTPVLSGGPAMATGFTTPGTVLTTALSSPWGMTKDASGNIYVVNSGTNKVSKFNPTGTTLLATYTLTNTGTMNGVTVDASGNLYVSNSNGRIYKYTVSSGVTTVVVNFNNTINGASLYDVVLDASGNLFATDQANGLIWKYNLTAGVPIQFIYRPTGGINTPSGLSVDPYGNIYIVDLTTKALIEYNAAGAFVATLATGLNNPYGLYIDANGDYFIGDSGANTVKEYNISGTLVSTFAATNPRGMVTDASGNLYVANATGNTLTKYAPYYYTLQTAAGVPTTPPPGLIFDRITGTFSGTPTSVFPTTTFKILVLGTDGNGATTVTITCTLNNDWVGTVSSDWNTPGNWSLGAVPIATGVAYIGVHVPFTNPPVVSTTGPVSVTIGSVYFGNLGGQAPGISVSSGYKLNVTADITKQSDANSNLNYVSYLSGAGTVKAANLNVTAGFAAAGTYTETLTSSVNSLQLSGNIALKDTTYNATFNLTGGTAIVAGKLLSTNVSGSTSTFTASASTLQLSNAAALSLAATGTNVVSFANAGSVVEYSGAAQTVYTDGAVTGLATGVSYQSIKFSGTGAKTAVAGNLNVSGDFTNTLTNDATNKLVLTGTTANFIGTTQNLAGGPGATAALPAAPGTGTTFNNVTFSGVGTKTIASGVFHVGSTGLLTMTGSSTTILNVNSTGNLTLNSDVNASATVTSLASGASITGNVDVQRYLTGGSTTYRGYRLLSSPVNNGSNLLSINYLQKSCYMTGTTGTAGGFDAGVNNPTLYFFRENLVPDNITSFTTGNFRGVNNITAPPTYSIDNDGGGFNLPIANGYLFFFRGDRNLGIPLSSQNGSYAPTATILTATGALNQGAINVNTWYTPGGSGLLYSTTSGLVGIEGFNLVGNPYASSIDWDTYNTSAISQSGVGPFIYILDPVSKNYNVYQAGGSGLGNIATANSNVIASGQGFFVVANNNNATLTFNESAKTNTQVAVANRNMYMGVPPVLANIPSLHIMLSKDSVNLDGIFVNFNNNAKTKYVFNEDAPHKVGFGTASLASRSDDNVTLAYNVMPFPKQTQVIPMSVGAGVDGNYQFRLNVIKNIPAIYEVWLKDAFTKDSIDLRNNNTYGFNVVRADTNTYGNSRFTLVIRQNPGLNLHLLSFTGKKITLGNQLVWTVENEQNYTNFTVERSIDNGATYQVLGGLKSDAQGTYSYTDKSPGLLNNMYRLKLEDLNGTISYSSIVIIGYGTLANSHAGINVYPNPTANTLYMAVVDDNTGTQTLNGAANIYNIKIVNINGATVQNATSPTANWQANVSKLTPGNYIIQVTNTTTNKIVGKTTFVKL